MKKYLGGFIFLFSSMVFGMESMEKITEKIIDVPIANNNVAPKILSKEIHMSKSLQESDHLNNLALKHARFFFDRRQQNLSRDSPEHKLVFYALLAIEKTFPVTGRFHKDVKWCAPYMGYKNLALLPESSIKGATADSLKNFFNRYRIVYEGFNSFREDIYDNIKSLNLAEETIDEEDKQEIKKINKEIQQANASWQKPDLSSPLQFVYIVRWDAAAGDFASTRYFIIEVKKLPSDSDDEFRAQVTIKKRFGFHYSDRCENFYETFFPTHEISFNDAISILGL